MYLIKIISTIYLDNIKLEDQDFPTHTVEPTLSDH